MMGMPDRQGRWMQQLNRVMRIARVKILIGPQRLDDVGRLELHCWLVDVRPLARNNRYLLSRMPVNFARIGSVLGRDGSNLKCIAEHSRPALFLGFPGLRAPIQRGSIIRAGVGAANVRAEKDSPTSVTRPIRPTTFDSGGSQCFPSVCQSFRS